MDKIIKEMKSPKHVVTLRILDSNVVLNCRFCTCKGIIRMYSQPNNTQIMGK